MDGDPWAIDSTPKHGAPTTVMCDVDPQDPHRRLKIYSDTCGMGGSCWDWFGDFENWRASGLADQELDDL